MMQQTPSPVSFSLGDLSPLDEEQPASLPEISFRTSISPVSDTKRNVTMPRSVSQEAHVHLAADREGTPPKVSHSESSLEAAAAVTLRAKKLPDSYGTSSLEEETYSTDSSSTATPTEEEMKRKRRKLHFPTFTRKSKSTGKSPSS
ncbi:hypothetical protein B566_EDAN004071 [Ephemera danica]|nr:hypothetical protein B566_EDAN004071 [Ephemera danica]